MRSCIALEGQSQTGLVKKRRKERVAKALCVKKIANALPFLAGRLQEDRG